MAGALDVGADEGPNCKANAGTESVGAAGAAVAVACAAAGVAPTGAGAVAAAVGPVPSPAEQELCSQLSKKFHINAQI